MPPTSTTNINTLVQDDNHVSVQIGSSFLTSDIDSHSSPLSYSSAIIGLKKPLNAVELVISPSTDLRISEDPLMATYDIIIADSKEAIPLGKAEFIYITRDSQDGSATFRYTVV